MAGEEHQWYTTLKEERSTLWIMVLVLLLTPTPKTEEKSYLWVLQRGH